MSESRLSFPRMQFALTDEQQQIVELCDRLGKDALEPGADERDRNYRYPREPMLALARAGVNSLTLPKEYGGLGLGHFAYALAAETLARYDPSTAMVYVMHLSAVQTLNLAGNPEQKQRLLPPVREEGK